MNMEDMLKNKCYCLTFKRVCLLNCSFSFSHSLQCCLMLVELELGGKNTGW